MKLVADDKGRLTCAELFPPQTAFDAVREPDGTIRLAEIPEKEVPVVRPRRINGRLRGADIELDAETIAAAVRADRDER